ncbi:MAG: mannose-1-phosphate guanylyltransferase [Bacteroidales bacterium]|jgi:mannose-1-phosphate guanylyltransferase|nr:mannose-1-phosphate guanylyltransferase [Bacteroidales bacterium]
MKNPNYYCVIMAGGVGTRFWPMSRRETPKQFIDILGMGKSLLQQTFDRFAAVCPEENIYVVTGKRYKDLVLKQLPALSEKQVLCEPYRRNTAPCIAYANHKIVKQNPDAVVAVTPADHVVMKPDIFTNVVSGGMEAASNNDWLITIGIRPSYPNTGYGYIQFNDEEMSAANNQIKKVKVFTEKPSLEMAQQFIASGDFLWNAGIFIWSVKSSIKSFEENLPEVEELFAASASVFDTAEEESEVEKIYSVCKSISIDYGVMEKAKNVYVMASDFGWSDLGTWGSLYDLHGKDSEGNAVSGGGVLLYDVSGSVVKLPDGKVAVLQGLHDYIVAEDKDMLLICKKSEEQHIRKMVNDVEVRIGEQYV